MSGSVEVTQGAQRRQPSRSRLDTKRQKKIADMVDGYYSGLTVATGLRNLFWFWAIPGGLLTLLGVLGLSRHRFSSEDDLLVQAITSIQMGMALLGFFTVVAFIVFAVRTWANVKCLGKRTKIGYWSIFKRHMLAMVLGFAATIGGGFMPDLAPILVPLAMVLFVYGGSFLCGWFFEIIRMFWRSGSQPTGVEDELPHWGVGWMVALFTYSSTAGYVEAYRTSPRLFALMAILNGASCVIAALLAAKLVVEMSRRQDERLATILTQLDRERGETSEPVTVKQFESAWETSEKLVSFDY